MASDPRPRPRDRAPLDESTAIEVGKAPGSLVLNHVIHEATHTQGEIVTAAPWKHPPGVPPLWTL